jgi:hypothetical protein
MKFERLTHDFAVCKLKSTNYIDWSKEFVFLAKTDDEISLVCSIDGIPEDALEIEKDWKGLRISGVLDFSMVGVIAKISNLLAGQSISIFVISTYNTDYILLKSKDYKRATAIFQENGYTLSN